jgi:hypothetical protein
VDEPPPPRRKRWSVEMIAMLLLAALIVTPCAAILIFSVRCSWNFTESFCTHNWGFRDWLSETIPVLVAIIMRGAAPRPPPDE